MMVLAVSHNTGDPTPHLHAEAARMAELQQAGLVELMLLKADWSGVVLLLCTADLAAAREAVGSLPLVTNGITSFELTEVITPGSTSPPRNHSRPDESAQSRPLAAVAVGEEDQPRGQAAQHHQAGRPNAAAGGTGDS